VFSETACGRYVVPRPAARVNQDDNQYGQGADRDSKYLYPAWCAGVAGGVSHARVLLSRAICGNGRDVR
jgi:hypothetical protein